MPLGLEGTLTPNEVYSLTAYLLFLNNVIPEDQVLDKKVCRRSGCRLAMNSVSRMSFIFNALRLKGYPY